MTRGEWQELEESGGWAGATAATVLAGKIYVVAEGSLYRVDPATGGYEQVGDDSWKTRFLVAAGNRLLGIEEGGAMYSIDPTDGSYQELESGWANTTAAVGLDNRAFVVADGTLYAVDPADGSYAQVGDDSWKTRFLVAVGNQLLAIEEGGALYAVNPSDGAYQELESGWANTTAATGCGGMAYVVCDGTLYAVTPSDGSSEAINDDTWKSRFLLGVGNRLVTIEEGGELYGVALA